MTSRFRDSLVLWQLLRGPWAALMIIAVAVVLGIAVLAVTGRAYEFRLRWKKDGFLELNPSRDVSSSRVKDRQIRQP